MKFITSHNTHAVILFSLSWVFKRNVLSINFNFIVLLAEIIGFIDEFYVKKIVTTLTKEDGREPNIKLFNQQQMS